MSKDKKAAATAGAQPKPTMTQVPGRSGFVMTAEWAWYWIPVFLALALCFGAMIAAGFFMSREKPEPLLIGAAALVCMLSVGALIPLSLRQAPGV